MVVGRSDSISAPENLSEALGSRSRSQDRRSIIYGWPTVVVVDRDHVPKVAPLFSVQIEPERGTDNEWRLHATVEPEFNLAITASGIFDPSITEEIGNLLGNGLPFGDADAFADLAGRTAGVLGLDIHSPLDSGKPNTHVGRRHGVYNAAISVVTEASGFNVALIEELSELQRCKDWTTTAAAHLLPRDSVPEKSKRLAPVRTACSTSRIAISRRKRHSSVKEFAFAVVAISYHIAQMMEVVSAEHACELLQVGVDAGALRGLVAPRRCLLDTETIGTVVGDVEPRHSRDFQPFFTAPLAAVPEALKAIGVGATFGDEGGVDDQGLLMVGRDDLGNGRLVEGDKVKGPVVPGANVRS